MPAPVSYPYPALPQHIKIPTFKFYKGEQSVTTTFELRNLCHYRRCTRISYTICSSSGTVLKTEKPTGRVIIGDWAELKVTYYPNVAKEDTWYLTVMPAETSSVPSEFGPGVQGCRTLTLAVRFEEMQLGTVEEMTEEHTEDPPVVLVSDPKKGGWAPGIWKEWLVADKDTVCVEVPPRGEMKPLDDKEGRTLKDVEGKPKDGCDGQGLKQIKEAEAATADEALQPMLQQIQEQTAACQEMTAELTLMVAHLAELNKQLISKIKNQ